MLTGRKAAAFRSKGGEGGEVCVSVRRLRCKCSLINPESEGGKINSIHKRRAHCEKASVQARVSGRKKHGLVRVNGLVGFFNS